jgi:hypothetical protein
MSRDVYEIAKKAVWPGTVEAPDKRAALEDAAQEFKTEVCGACTRCRVATILLTFGVAAAGAVAFFQLPVAPLPQVDFPTISVVAQLPGAGA